jgi:hypothetical protein
MSLGFPTTPSVDDIHTVGGKTWRWNDVGWEVVTVPSFTLVASAIAPETPAEGDLWLDLS